MARYYRESFKNRQIKSKNIVTREIEGKLILMPLVKTSKELNFIYTLNETAARAWALIDGKTALSDIPCLMVEEYEVDVKRVAKQLAELVKDLKSIKALV